MAAHPVCDAVEDGHVCRSSTGTKESKALPESEWICKKDGERWPCKTILRARQENAARSQKRELQPLHNTPDRLTGATR